MGRGRAVVITFHLLEAGSHDTGDNGVYRVSPAGGGLLSWSPRICLGVHIQRLVRCLPHESQSEISVSGPIQRWFVGWQAVDRWLATVGSRTWLRRHVRLPHEWMALFSIFLSQSFSLWHEHILTQIHGPSARSRAPNLGRIPQRLTDWVKDDMQRCFTKLIKNSF